MAGRVAVVTARQLRWRLAVRIGEVLLVVAVLATIEGLTGGGPR